MRRSLAALLAVTALAASGCAVSNAASAPPTPAASTPAPAPRPSASPGFERRAPAQVIHTIDTNKNVVFLTLDDGLNPDPALLQFLKDNNIPVTVFLTTGTVTDWQYWKDFGAVASIQNHSVTHPSLPGLGEPGAQNEICGANDAIETNTITTPWMVRPPYGAYDASTLAAAGDCGLDYVVHWSVSLPADKLEYQVVGGSLEPGDIILTHFRKDLASVLPKVIDDIHQQGFEVGRLEDYLTPRGWPKPNDPQTSPSDMQMETKTESRAYLVE